VKASEVNTPAITGQQAALPAMVEHAGPAARFAWDEFFYAEHHNPHTQNAYERAVRRFLGWVEKQGVEMVSITPGMVGQYLVALGGSPAKRNQHLVILNPAASVKGVRDQAVEGKTPEIGIEPARMLLASIDCRVPGTGFRGHHT
jgi:integrase/recombinase XerD